MYFTNNISNAEFGRYLSPKEVKKSMKKSGASYTYGTIPRRKRKKVKYYEMSNDEIMAQLKKQGYRIPNY